MGSFESSEAFRASREVSERDGNWGSLFVSE